MGDMPVYVKIHEPREIQETIRTLRVRIQEANATMDLVDSLSMEESVKMRQWNEKFEQLVERIDEMSEQLHTPEKV